MLREFATRGGSVPRTKRIALTGFCVVTGLSCGGFAHKACDAVVRDALGQLAQQEEKGAHEMPPAALRVLTQVCAESTDELEAYAAGAFALCAVGARRFGNLQRTKQWRVEIERPGTAQSLPTLRARCWQVKTREISKARDVSIPVGPIGATRPDRWAARWLELRSELQLCQADFLLPRVSSNRQHIHLEAAHEGAARAWLQAILRHDGYQGWQSITLHIGRRLLPTMAQETPGLLTEREEHLIGEWRSRSMPIHYGREGTRRATAAAQAKALAALSHEQHQPAARVAESELSDDSD